MKKAILPTLILSLLLALIFVMSGCTLISEEDKKRVLDAYTSEDTSCKFYTFKAKVRSISYINAHYENEKYYAFNVDYEYFQQAYGDDDYIYPGQAGRIRWESRYSSFNARKFKIVPSSYRLLCENGGYDLLQEGTEVIITANNYEGWLEWIYPILSLEIDGITYLDYETGLENYLNYVKAGFKDP